MQRALIVLALGLLIGTYVFAQETPTTSETTPTDPVVLAKLDQILANQQTLLKRFDAVDAELKIIRVRASQKH